MLIGAGLQTASAPCARARDGSPSSEVARNSCETTSTSTPWDKLVSMRDDSLGSYTITTIIANPPGDVTARAKRYRAQQNVSGPKQCVLCGSKKDLGVMHLSGDEDHGEKKNLAWGCRSCNQKLAAAWKRAGSKVRTKQYNPGSAVIPTFQQYAWAVANHKRGAHDEGGAVIHATPKAKRIQYARRIAGIKAAKKS